MNRRPRYEMEATDVDRRECNNKEKKSAHDLRYFFKKLPRHLWREVAI